MTGLVISLIILVLLVSNILIDFWHVAAAWERSRRLLTEEEIIVQARALEVSAEAVIPVGQLGPPAHLVPLKGIPSDLAAWYVALLS